MSHPPVRLLVLSRAEVEELLDLDRLVDAVGAALADMSEGRASVPARVAALVEDRHALLAAMPAFLPSAPALTTKLVSLFPENRDVPTHQAVIVCFDPATGAPIALMDGTAITAARTAAGSALATRLLARPDARVVAVIGTGVQARAHVAALAREARVGRILVAGREPAAAERLVAETTDAIAVPLEVAASIEAAVREADIVCLATHAAEPVAQREWLRPGTHVNSVGYNTSGRGELDGAIIRDGYLVVESRSAALAPPPAGSVELNRAIADGLITADHIRAELGELVGGRVIGRTDAAQITVYKSVGVAAEDAAAAALVFEAARERGIGSAVEL